MTVPGMLVKMKGRSGGGGWRSRVVEEKNSKQ
jgi:hypothetical protein